MKPLPAQRGEVGRRPGEGRFGRSAPHPSPLPAAPAAQGEGAILLLFLLTAGCLDVVEHGITVGLTVRTTNCENASVIAGATQLHLTAKSGEAVLLDRTAPIESIPRALGLPESTDAVLRVEALDATGKVLARGTSLHFPVAVTPITQVSVQLHPVDGFSRVCATLGSARAFHTATALADGRVLLVGGQGNAGEALSSMEVLGDVEVRDVGPLALRAQGNVYRLPRAHHAAVAGNSGQVIIAGGETGLALLSSVLFIDPTVDFGIGALAPQLQLEHPTRTRHAAFRLDSKVFLLGGNTTELGQAIANPSVARLDLATNQLESVSTLPSPRRDAALAQLGTLAVVAGGLELSAPSARVDVVRLGSSALPAQLTLTTARTRATAVAVGDRVLVAGGLDRRGAPLTSTEWISPGAVEPGPAITARAEPCAVALPGGQALLVGGVGATGPSGAAERVNADGTAVALTFPGAARHGHACLALEDGTVLIIGGLDVADRPLDDVWRYTPAP
ncbi:MAG: kelch repeat-containing protein [Archangium sp.]|nr:kelch repeat-containing protein [Archangium sp.]